MIFIPADMKNIQTYYLLSILFGFYILQKVILSEHRNYILIFLIVLGILIYEVYKKREKLKTHFYDKKENFIQYTIDITKKSDVENSLFQRNYKKAFTLLNSERVLWKTLHTFQKFSHGEPNAFKKIIVLIVRFYEDYGYYLKHKNLKVPAHVIISNMVIKRQDIMNAIQEFHLQTLSDKEMNKTINSISIIIMACLEKCLRVLRHKFKAFHTSAPYAINMMGDEMQLY